MIYRRMLIFFERDAVFSGTDDRASASNSGVMTQAPYDGLNASMRRS